VSVLVTGGSGFIGRYVVDELLRQGRSVVVFDRRYPAEPVPGVSYFFGDIRDSIDTTEAMAHAQSYIHLAGVLGTQETIQNPMPAVETNILGGLNVLGAARQYGVPGVQIAVGNHWMNNTYAISKSTMERFAEMYQTEHGLPITTVRALNAYGPRQVPSAPYGSSKVRKIMPSFVCRALTQTPIEIYGDGSQIMDMIHVRDVASILVTALEYTSNHGAAQGVVEAGTGRRTTVHYIARTVLEQVPAYQGAVSYLDMRPGEPPQSQVRGDPSTLKWIGYDADLTLLEDGVLETVQWFRDHWLPAHQRGADSAAA